MSDIAENLPEEEITEEERQRQLSEVLQVRRDKLDALTKAGHNPFEKVKFDFDTYTVQIKNEFEAYEGKTVRIAGRMMSRRDMGKANFIDIMVTLYGSGHLTILNLSI